MLGLVIVGLLALVALAARGGHPTGHGRASDREVPESLQDSLITLIAIAYAATLVGVIVVMFRYRGSWKPVRSRWLRNFFILLLVFAVVVPVGYRLIVHGGLREKAQQAQQREQQRQNARLRPSDKPPKPLPGRRANFDWPIAFALGGLLVIGSVLLIVRRRPLPPSAHRLPVEEELAAVVTSSIDDLRNEPDARRAVIAAYANMERVLASNGLTRRGAEAPFEYLARILRDLKVRNDAVRSLTELFEYAKFSAHEIDTAMKEEAIAALEAVREDLQPAPASEAA